MDGSDDASVLRSLALRRMGTHMTSPGSFFRGQLETMLEMSGVLGPHGAGGSVARGPFHPATNAAAASLPYQPTLHTTAPIASPNLASAMGSPRGRQPIQQQQQQLQQQQSLHHYQEEQERQATAAESGDVAIVVDEDGASTRNAAEPRLISSSPHYSPAQEMTSLRSCNDLEAALPSGVPSALGVECHSPAEAAASAAASGCQSQQRPAMDCNSGRLQGDERTACGGQGCTRELACGGLREQQAGTPAQQGSLQQQQQQQQQHHHHQLPQSPLLQGQTAGHGQLRQPHLLSHVLHQSTQQFPPLPSFQLQVQQQHHHQQQQEYQEQSTLLHRYHNHDDQNQQQQQQQHHNQQQQPQHQQQAQEQQQQQQRYDLSVAARWLEQAIPFGLLVAVVFIREHLLGAYG